MIDGTVMVGPVEVGHVDVTVTDHGEGVAPGDLGRLLSNFFRPDDAAPSGRGLGRWIGRAPVQGTAVR